MKKIYQNPTTTIVRLQTIQMIAGSFEGTLNSVGGDGSDALSRDGYDWDDED